MPGCGIWDTPSGTRQLCSSPEFLVVVLKQLSLVPGLIEVFLFFLTRTLVTVNSAGGHRVVVLGEGWDIDSGFSCFMIWLIGVAAWKISFIKLVSFFHHGIQGGLHEVPWWLPIQSLIEQTLICLAAARWNSRCLPVFAYHIFACGGEHLGNPLLWFGGIYLSSTTKIAATASNGVSAATRVSGSKAAAGV